MTPVVKVRDNYVEVWYNDFGIQNHVFDKMPFPVFGKIYTAIICLQ